MKIDPHGHKPQIPLNRNDEVTSPRNNSLNSASEQTPGIIKGEVPELPQLTLRVLTAQLKDATGIRDEVVNAAKAKLAAGDYLTDKAAEDTAQAILGE